MSAALLVQVGCFFWPPHPSRDDSIPDKRLQISRLALGCARRSLYERDVLFGHERRPPNWRPSELLLLAGRPDFNNKFY